jgi:sugar O-acyltransferase (sialic acid O-acetyltransferase NeuD family)
MTEGILIIGGGGHAKQVIETLRLTDPNAQLAIIDAKPALGTTVLGVPVVGIDDSLQEAAATGFRSFAMGLGGVGDNRPRANAFTRARSVGLMPRTVVHPSAIVASSAVIGTGTVCLFGAIIGAEAFLGEDVIVSSGAIVEHDCRIGDHAHVAPGAVVAGSVEVGTLAHVGAGAVIRQGVRIGSNALVGAGAMVTKEVPSGVTVAGVPARIMERL